MAELQVYEQPSAIGRFLARTRTQLYRHEWRRTSAYAVSLLVLLAIVVPSLGYLVGAKRATAYAVLGIGGLAAVLVVIGTIVVGLVVPRRRWGDDRDVARWVGSRRSDVASDLLSSVELADAPPRTGAPSPALVAALLTSTEERLDGVVPEELLPQDQIVRAQRWALAVTLTKLAIMILVPGVVAEGWRRLVIAPVLPYDGAAMSAVPLVGDLEATLDFPAYARRPSLKLESSSGDIRGLPGTAVTLRARTLVPALSAELLIEMPDGIPMSVPVEIRADRATARFSITRPARYRFAITSQDGSRSVEKSPRTIDTETDRKSVV